MQIDTRLRTIVKTVSWRLFGSLTTGLFIYLISGEMSLALLSGGFDIFAKSGLFFIHERLWNRLRFGRRDIEAQVIWLTGLSGAGKSTIAQILAEKLRKNGLRVEELDGDLIRSIFPQIGFDRTSRDQHIRRVGYLASRLEKNGVFVIASLISPYQESRDFARSLCKNFIEVHISTPLEECEKRDPKGLYLKARRGEIQNMTGLTDPYEEPTRPELRIDTLNQTPDQCAEIILQSLQLSRSKK